MAALPQLTQGVTPVGASAQQPTGVKTDAPVTGCARWRALVSKYPWDTKVALAVMQAESGCTADRVGDNYPIRGVYAPSCGLMQIRTLKGRPKCDELKDPELNMAWAYRLYQAHGWKPWSAYINGSYKKFM